MLHVRARYYVITHQSCRKNRPNCELRANVADEYCDYSVSLVPQFDTCFRVEKCHSVGRFPNSSRERRASRSGLGFEPTVCLCSGFHSLLTLRFCLSPPCFDSDPPYRITITGTTSFMAISASFSCPDKKKVQVL